MGFRRTDQLPFFFRLFLGEKQFTRSPSLYFRVLHGTNIAVRVAFDHHRAFQRRKQADSSWRERCRLPACRVNSLFLLNDPDRFISDLEPGNTAVKLRFRSEVCFLLWRDIFQRPSARSLWWSHLPANIEPQSAGRRTRTEFARVRMHAALNASGDPRAWKKHDSRPVFKFVVSMKHSARLGSKKILSDPRKLRKEPVEEAINREGKPDHEFGKGLSSLCVHVYAGNHRDAIIV